MWRVPTPTTQSHQPSSTLTIMQNIFLVLFQNILSPMGYGHYHNLFLIQDNIEDFDAENFTLVQSFFQTHIDRGIRYSDIHTDPAICGHLFIRKKATNYQGIKLCYYINNYNI